MERAAHGFASAMAETWRRRRTALIRVSAQQVSTTVSFLGGVPVWATGGARSETLGRLCVRLGLIDEAQYEQAILRLAELDAAGQLKKLGEVLIELGFLDAGQRQRALRAQVRERIIACFQWEDAATTIDDDELIRDGNLAPWPVPALMAEGVVRYFNEARCDRILEPELHRPARSFEGPSVVAALLNLPPELLATFGEEQRLDQSCTSLLSKQIGAALLLLGFLDVIGTEDIASQLRLPSTMDLNFGVEPPPDTVDMGELEANLWAEQQRLAASASAEAYFGLEPNATRLEIEAAFAARVRPFVNASEGEAVEKQPGLAEMYNAIAAARDSLLERSDSSIRTAPDSQTLTAEALFVRGKQLLDRGERKAAVEMFSTAIEKSPNTREYHMFRAYTDMLRATADWDRDKAFAETKKFAKETLAQDAKNGKAHLIMGRLWRLEGKEERARQEFERAVEVANDKEAELELRLIERRAAKKAEKPKRSLFFWKKP